jgi:hypothetical protein
MSSFEDLMPGVVSLPHGWGHDVEKSRLAVARAQAGGPRLSFATAQLFFREALSNRAGGSCADFWKREPERVAGRAERSDPEGSARRAGGAGAIVWEG